MTSGLHETLITPDDRGRFGLKRYLPRPTPARWKLFVEEGGNRLVLEAIEEES